MSITATIDKPNRSHYLATAYGSGGELAKEELYPILNVTDIPRVGTVRAEFEANRYVHTGGWSEWRIFLRRTDPANGVGEKTSRAISDAGAAVIREWLASDEYTASRRVTAAHMVRRIIAEGASRSYGIDNAKKELARHHAELDPADAERFERALDLLAQANALLDA